MRLASSTAIRPLGSSVCRLNYKYRSCTHHSNCPSRAPPDQLARDRLARASPTYRALSSRPIAREQSLDFCSVTQPCGGMPLPRYRGGLDGVYSPEERSPAKHARRVIKERCDSVKS
jgi:hypothetical protein